MKLKNSFGALVVMVGALAAVAQTARAHPSGAPDQYFFYQLVLLKRPSNAPQLDAEEGQKLQEAHMANIRLLANEGKLLLAGPFLDETPLRGIFVLNTQSLEEAERWTRTDPAVKANRLSPEIHTWIQTTRTFNKAPQSNAMENYAVVVYAKGDKFQGHNGKDPILRQHLAFLERQKGSGDLVVDGWFRDGSWADSVALLIFAASPEAASQIVAEDPLVLAGEVKPEVHPWMTQKGVLRK